MDCADVLDDFVVPPAPEPYPGPDPGIRFARLVAYSKRLRGLAMLMRDRDESWHRIRMLMQHNELADLQLYLDSDIDDACSKYHAKWLSDVRSFYRLPQEPGVLSSMSYLFFDNVSDHNDGERVIGVEGRYEGHPAMFLNIQLVGSGVLTVQGQTRRILPGDAYLLDPSSQHSFANEHRRTCRAVSFDVPMGLVPSLLASSSSPASIQY